MLVFSLDHHAHQGLSPGIAHHQPAFVAKGLRHPLYRLRDRFDGREIATLTHLHINQHLWVALHNLFELGERALTLDHDREEREKRHQAIAGGVHVQEHNVP